MPSKLVINKAIVALVLVNSSISISSADHDNQQKAFDLGSITFSGEGCTSQSYKMDKLGNLIISPKGFIVSTRGEQNLQRKACTFAIPFSIKANQALRISKPVVSGISRISKDSSAQINYELFSAGHQDQPLAVKLEGSARQVTKNFKLSDKNQFHISECGKSGIIRGNASLAINRNASTEVSMILIKELGLNIDTVNCN